MNLEKLREYDEVDDEKNDTVFSRKKCFNLFESLHYKSGKK